MRTWWCSLPTPAFALGLVVGLAGGAHAQDTTASSALRRIDSLHARRDTRGALRIADSLLADTDLAARLHADALYWRGLLTEPASKGRLDLLRVVIDHPLSPRAGDALYQLARQDLQVGDLAGARRRLDHAMRDYTGHQFSADVALELGRLLMTTGEYRPGCIALDSALARLAANQVERRNEVTYLRRPCERIPAEIPAADSSRPTGRPVEHTTPADSSVRTRPATGGISRAATGRPVTAGRQWSAQVAAYTARADAERSATRLTARGYDARITAERPYRVRIGRFATRQDAATMVKWLQAEGTKAIIVEAERP